MTGIVKYRRGDGFVEAREVPVAPPAANQVRIEVKAVGICGSDLHVYHDDIKIPIVPPVVMGHEFSGVVVEKGRDVGDTISLDDRVTGESSVWWCGACRHCAAGDYNLCTERKVLGYSANGCYARYCNVTSAHRLPDNVSFEAGALTEPLACCVHGTLERTGVSSGDFVAVIGPGPIGILSALVAASAGATVCLCGTAKDAGRLALAATLGIAHCLDVEKTDAAAEVRRRTGGYGADVVLECSGSTAGARLGLELVRKRGKYTQLGLFGRRIEIDFELIAFKEIAVTGSISQHRPSWVRALQLMQGGSVPAGRLVTHELPLEEWEEGFRLVETKQCLKAILRP